MGLCCCKGSDDGDELESQHSDIPSFRMNKTHRSCTDKLILLLFLGSFGALFYILYDTVSLGANPYRLIQGVDYQNRICGYSAGVSSEPYAAWPWIEFDLFTDLDDLKTMFDLKVCVSDCSKTQTSDLILNNHESTALLYYCIPTFNTSSALEAFESLQETEYAQEVFARTTADLSLSWVVIAASIPISIVATFMFIGITIQFAGCLVWSSILMTVGGALVLSYQLLHYEAESFGTLSEEEAQYVVEVLGWVVFGVAEVLLIIILLLRERILIAIEVVREASKSIFALITMFFVPPVFAVFGVLYFVLWIFVATFIYSVQIAEETSVTLPDDIAGVLGITTYTDYQWDSSIRNYAWFHVFHLLWVIQFLIYGAYITISGALADWYFTKRDEDGHRLRGGGDEEFELFPMLKSFWRFIRYNVGTVAFAGLLIAIIQIIQAIVAYMEENSWEEKNVLQKVIFGMVQCCLCCFKCCIDKMNKNALVYCAIYNKHLCHSAVKQFVICWRNLGRVVALNIVTEFFITVGKLSVSFFTTAMCGYYLQSNDTRFGELSSLLLPCTIICLFAYLISSLILIVLEGSIDTIFFCFLVDFENNKDREMYAPPSLVDLVQKHETSSKDIALRRRWADPHDDHDGSKLQRHGTGISMADLGSGKRESEDSDDSKSA